MTLGHPVTFRHILHPTDLSPDGDVAFQHALAIALRDRAALSVIHTGQTNAIGQEWTAFPRVRETLKHWGSLPLNATENDVVSLGVKIRKLDLEAREPGRAITDYALHNDCDLVVMATHARQGLGAWTRPSVAKPLARDLAKETSTPALFLPHGAAGFIDRASGTGNLRTVLLPIDFTPSPQRAVEAALGWARAFGAEKAVLHFLHVGAGHPPIPFEALSNFKIEVHAEEGDIAQTISRVAERIDADLIVMATHGHDGFLDILRGSTTEQVLHHSRRALLAIPAG